MKWLRRVWRWWHGWTVEEWKGPWDQTAETAAYDRILADPAVHWFALDAGTHWHHVVMTFRRGRTRVYFDGKPWPHPEIKRAARELR